MGALSIGPFALSLERALGVLAIVTFAVVSGIVAKGRPELEKWEGGALVSGLVLGRLFYVALHASTFLSRPLTVFYFWQGGFSPFGAVAGVLLFSLWRFRRAPANLVPAIAVLGAAFLVWGLPTTVTSVVRSRGEPIMMPSFRLSTLDGGEVEMADYVGTPTVINFWATWCPPCRREMPMLAAAARDTDGTSFVFVNQGEGTRVIEEYLVAESITLPNVLLDREQRLGAYFGIRGLPTTVFFDSQGVLVDYHFGELAEAKLRDYLERLE
ncbi:MAG: prolipoprotein diacylglyceryl transferase family protein [Spirochaetota bacterium]